MLEKRIISSPLGRLAVTALRLSIVSYCSNIVSIFVFCFLFLLHRSGASRSNLELTWSNSECPRKWNVDQKTERNFCFLFLLFFVFFNAPCCSLFPAKEAENCSPRFEAKWFLTPLPHLLLILEGKEKGGRRGLDEMRWYRMRWYQMRWNDAVGRLAGLFLSKSSMPSS